MGGWWERGASARAEQDVASLSVAVPVSPGHGAFPWVLPPLGAGWVGLFVRVTAKES